MSDKDNQNVTLGTPTRQIFLPNQQVANVQHPLQGIGAYTGANREDSREKVGLIFFTAPWHFDHRGKHIDLIVRNK